MSWQKDVTEIRGIMKKGGERHLAELIVRVVAQIGAKKAAAEIGVSTTTIGRYTKTWEMLADQGLVLRVKDTKPDTTYDFDAVGLDQDKWAATYEAARYTLSDGKKVSKRQPGTSEVVDALEDPAKELAVRNALAKKDAQRKLDKAKKQAGQEIIPASTDEQLTDWMAGTRKVERELAALLGLATELPKDTEAREIVRGTLTELGVTVSRYLDALIQVTEGKGMEAELADLLAGGLE